MKSPGLAGPAPGAERMPRTRHGVAHPQAPKYCLVVHGDTSDNRQAPSGAEGQAGVGVSHVSSRRARHEGARAAHRGRGVAQTSTRRGASQPPATPIHCHSVPLLFVGWFFTLQRPPKYGQWVFRSFGLANIHKFWAGGIAFHALCSDLSATGAPLRFNTKKECVHYVDPLMGPKMPSVSEKSFVP